MGSNFAQSAKDKKKCKAEGGKKRDHNGSWEKQGIGQRAGGWKKKENMKNKTRGKIIVRQKAFPLLPWL